MTVLDSEEIIFGLPPIQQASLFEQSGRRAQQPITAFGTIEDAFQQENLLLNAINFASEPRRFRPVPGYNAFVDDEELVTAFPDFASEFIGSNSPEESERIASEISEEQDRRERLARSGFFGFMAQMAAGILSPENLLPVSLLVRGARGVNLARGLGRAQVAARAGAKGFGRGFVNVGVAGAVQETVAQVGLGATQRTRTMEEQVFNVMGAAVISGILGGTIRSFVETRADLQELVVSEMGGGLGWARMQEVLNSKKFQGLSGDEQRNKLIELLSLRNPVVAGFLKTPKSFLGRLWRKVGFRWNPSGTLGTSKSGTFVISGKRLADTPLLRVDDVKLGDDVGTSVEAAVTLSYMRTADTILQIRDVYTAARKSGLRMKESVFRTEVTRAMRRGDKAAENIVETGARDAINRAAKIARKMFNAMSDDAEKVGFLSTRELKGTAESYVTRVWDREYVSANQAELKKIFVEHFSNDHNLRTNPEELADQAIDSILGSRTGSNYIPKDVVGEAGSFRERLLLVRDKDVEEFLENDIMEVMTRFVNEASPQIELAKAFRTASSSLDGLPARLDAAVARAERTGETDELVDILEDAGNLRAAAALASLFSEQGISKARHIERLLDRMPELRTQHRELVKRHHSQRVRVDQYEEALQTRKEIQEEIGGAGFNELPKSVRGAFETEIVEKELVPNQRRVTAAEERVGSAKGKVRDLVLEQKKQRTRSRRRQKGKADRVPVDQDPQVQKVSEDLTAARAARDVETGRLKEAKKALGQKRRELFKSQATRNKFFHTWRRWIAGEDEALFPATRRALSRFSAAPKAARLRGAGTEYIEATKRVEALRANISRTKSTASRLAQERDAAEAAIDEAKSVLEGFRKEANALDSGVPLKIEQKTETVKDLVRAAGNAIGAARRADAKRAMSLEAVIASGRRDFAKLKDEPGADTDALQKELNREILDMEMIRDRLLNKAGLEGVDPHDWAFRAERTFRRINFMRFMGGVTLSSIPDLAMSVLVNGLGPTIRAWRAALRNPLEELGNALKLKPTDVLSGLSAKEELVRFAVALELASGARVKAFGDIGDMLGGTGKIEKGIDRLSETFANFTLINRWNAWHKGIATLAVMNRMTDDIARLVAGKLGRSGRLNLAAGGVNASMAKRIKDQLDEFGTSDGGQVLPRTQDWTDLEAKKIFQEAVVADVRRTIITPSAGDLPKWMSRPFLRMMGQFKSFSMSSTTKILFSGLQRHDAAVVQGAVFSVMLGGAAWAIKEQLRGRDPFDQDEGVWIQNSIDRSGILGILMDVNGVLERATHGRFGLSAVTSGVPATRMQPRNVVDAFLGPSVGTAVDAVQLFGAPFGEGGATQKDLSVGRRMVPFNQVFYLRWAFDKFEGTIADAFDLPEDAKQARERIAQ